MNPRILTVVALLLATTAALQGHDYWLQPDSFFPKVGQKVIVRLHDLQRLVPVHLRHQDVEEHEVVMPLAQFLQSKLPIFSG